MSMKDLSSIIINNKYQLTKRIGSGSYGIVYSAVHLFTGISYAIKIILKNNAPNTANNKQLLVELEKSLIYQALLNNGRLEATLLSLSSIEKNGTDCKFLREISLQLKVHRHPNVLSIYKVYDFQNSIFVVMDYYPEGDLFSTIVDQQRYKDDPYLIKSVFIQLVDAINYCHSKSVFHCDLKPENILVSDNGTKLILADFGLALQDKYINSNISCGSSYYMSPERIQNFSQAFNTVESHSIHIERLINPNSKDQNYSAHGNVKFPTSSGDVWSLAIILINLVTIRNPWLKASLQDTTFKAFVQNPKVLMKILPISHELFDILIKYLNLNPWERGSLFEFREDVLNCHHLTESGPLSVDSSIKSMDIITTASQYQIMHDLSHFEVCPMPVDHVKIDKIRSGELDAANTEIENDYIPRGSRNPNAGMLQPGIQSTHKECKSCDECGFGIEDDTCSSVQGGRSIESSSSEVSSTSTGSTGSQSSRNKIPEAKHENLLKKFFKYGPGGYNPTKNYNASAASTKRLHLSPFSRKSDSREQARLQQQQQQLQEQLTQQQSRNHLLQQRQLEQQRQQHQLQQEQFQIQQQSFQNRQLEQQRYENAKEKEHQLQEEKIRQQQQQIQNLQNELLQETNFTRQQQLEKLHHRSAYSHSPEQTDEAEKEFHEHHHHHHHHHYDHHYHPEDSPIQQEIAKPVIPDYQSIFPMPGLGHNKVVLGQDRPKKKFVTKRRQRRAIDKPSVKEKSTKRNEPEQEKEGSVEKQQLQQQPQQQQQQQQQPQQQQQLDVSIDQQMEDIYSDSTPRNSQKSKLSSLSNSNTDTTNGVINDSDSEHTINYLDSNSSTNSMCSAQSNPYVNRISASSDVNAVQQTLSTMSIISNASSATMATMATKGSTMDQTMNS